MMPSSNQRTYARFIPSEEVGDFTQWKFGAVDGSDLVEPPPEPEPEPPVVEPMSEVPVSEVPAAEVSESAPPDSAPAEPVEENLYAEFVVGVWVELITNRRAVRTQLTWASPHGTLFLFTAADGSTQSMTRRMRNKLASDGALRVVADAPTPIARPAEAKVNAPWPPAKPGKAR